MTAVLVTCEHGGHRLPRRYRHLFAGREEVLLSHRGWDPGALRLARALARLLRAPLVSSTWTRLLVDLNRSEGNPALWSRASSTLSGTERERLLEEIHRPHWQRVESEIRRLLEQGSEPRPVVHLAVHSFAPVLDGRVRRFDVGLLYDPRRAPEAGLAARWQRSLRRALPHLAVWRNHPYRGWTDGLPTRMRERFAPDLYLGIELEVSQRRLGLDGSLPVGLAPVFADSLEQADASLPAPGISHCVARGTGVQFRGGGNRPGRRSPPT